MLRPATIADQPAPRIACELPQTPPPAQAEPPSRVFLTAGWRNLVMLSWRVDPDVLASRVPRGVEIDSHRGTTYVSMVGFQFLDAQLLGSADSVSPRLRGSESAVLRPAAHRRRCTARRGVHPRNLPALRGLGCRAAGVQRALHDAAHAASRDAPRKSPSPRPPPRGRGRKKNGGRILLAASADVAAIERVRLRRRASPSARLAGGIHRRTLLGLYASARRRFDRVPRRASSLARAVGP